MGTIAAKPGEFCAVMSSNDSLSMVFKCLSKGAVDFLVKPIRKNELKNLWQHAWRKCRSVSCVSYLMYETTKYMQNFDVLFYFITQLFISPVVVQVKMVSRLKKIRRQVLKSQTRILAVIMRMTLKSLVWMLGMKVTKEVAQRYTLFLV